MSDPMGFIRVNNPRSRSLPGVAGGASGSGGAGAAVGAGGGTFATPRRPFTGFDRERVTYARLKPELLKSAEGKFVAIVGDEVVGPVESHADAERAGYERFGLGPLYIKQVLAEEPVAEVTRFIAP